MKTYLLKLATGFLSNYVFDLIIDLLINRLERFESGINWNKVEIDVMEYIRTLVNVKFLEDLFIDVALAIIGEFRFVFKDVLLSGKVWDAIRDQNYKKAAKLLKKAVLTRLRTGV